MRRTLGGSLVHAPTHPSPGNFLKIDTKRMGLVAFQSIKTTPSLGSKFKLKTSYMDGIVIYNFKENVDVIVLLDG